MDTDVHTNVIQFQAQSKQNKNKSFVMKLRLCN